MDKTKRINGLLNDHFQHQLTLIFKFMNLIEI